MWRIFCFFLIGLGLAGSVPAETGVRSAGLFSGSVFSWGGIGYESALDAEGSNAAVFLLGTVQCRDVEAGQQVRRYFLGPTLRPYLGLGLCEILGALGQRTVLSVSAFGAGGLDWTFCDVYHCGAEAVVHCSLMNIVLKSDNTMLSEGFFRYFLTPSLGLYLRREITW